MDETFVPSDAESIPVDSNEESTPVKKMKRFVKAGAKSLDVCPICKKHYKNLRPHIQNQNSTHPESKRFLNYVFCEYCNQPMTSIQVAAHQKKCVGTVTIDPASLPVGDPKRKYFEERVSFLFKLFKL